MNSRLAYRYCFLIFVLVASFAVAAPPTLIVNNTDDAGPGSLRHAVLSFDAGGVIPRFLAMGMREVMAGQSINAVVVFRFQNVRFRATRRAMVGLVNLMVPAVGVVACTWRAALH